MKLLRSLLAGVVLLNSAVLLAPPKKGAKDVVVPAVQEASAKREASAAKKQEILDFVRTFDGEVTSKLIDVTMRRQLNVLETKLAGYEPGKIKVKFNIDTALGKMLNALWQNLGTKKSDKVTVAVKPGPLTTDIVIEMSFQEMLQKFKSGNGVSGILDWPRMLGVDVDRESFELKSIHVLTEDKAHDVFRALSFASEEHFRTNVGNAQVQSILAFKLNEVNILALDDVEAAKMNPHQKTIKILVETLVKKLSDLVKTLNDTAALRQPIYAAAAELRAMLDAEFNFSGTVVAEGAPSSAKIRKRQRN